MEKEIYIKMKEFEDVHWWFCGRRRIVQNVISILKLPKTCKILDCGCGTGGNLSMLSEFGELFGIEPDTYSLTIAQNRNIGTLYNGYMPDEIRLPQTGFDLIILLDVLEHIDDHVSSLKVLKSLLVPKGYLILTVPAFKFLWSRHDEEHHHKRRYTASELKKIIQQAGLEILYLTYYNFWLFPIISLIRLTRKILPIKQVGADLWLPHPLINRFLLALFSSECFFIPRLRLPFGISLLAVAQKGNM